MPKTIEFTAALAEGMLRSLTTLEHPGEEAQLQIDDAIGKFERDTKALKKTTRRQADGTYTHSDKTVLDVMSILNRHDLRKALSEALTPTLSHLALSLELNEEQLDALISNDALLEQEDPFTEYYSRRRAELNSKKPRTSPLDAALDKLKAQFLNKEGNNWDVDVRLAIKRVLGKDASFIPQNPAARELFVELLLETSLNRFYDFMFQADIKKRMTDLNKTMPNRMDDLMAEKNPGVSFSGTSTSPTTFDFHIQQEQNFVDITTEQQYSTAKTKDDVIHLTDSTMEASCDVTTRVAIHLGQVRTEEINHEAFFEDMQVGEPGALPKVRPKSRKPESPRSPQSVLNIPGEEILPRFIEEESSLIRARSAASFNMKAMSGSMELLIFKKAMLEDTIKHLKQDKAMLTFAKNKAQIALDTEKAPTAGHLQSINNQIARRTAKRAAAGFFKQVWYAIADTFRRLTSGESVVDEYERIRQELVAAEKAIQTKHQPTLDEATRNLEQKKQELTQNEDKLKGLVEELNQLSMDKKEAFETRRAATTELEQFQQAFQQERDALIQSCNKQKDPIHQALAQYLENPITSMLHELEHMMLTKHRPNKTLDAHLARASKLYKDIAQATDAMHTLNNASDSAPLISVRTEQQKALASDLERLKNQMEELKQEKPSTISSALKWATKEKHTQAEQDASDSFGQKKTMLEQLRQADKQAEQTFQNQGEALMISCEAIEHPVDYVLKALLASPTTAALKALKEVMEDNPDFLANDALVQLIEKAGNLYPEVQALLDAQRLVDTSDISAAIKERLSGLNPNLAGENRGPDLTTH